MHRLPSDDGDDDDDNDPGRAVVSLHPSRFLESGCCIPKLLSLETRFTRSEEPREFHLRPCTARLVVKNSFLEPLPQTCRVGTFNRTSVHLQRQSRGAFNPEALSLQGFRVSQFLASAVTPAWNCRAQRFGTVVRIIDLVVHQHRSRNGNNTSDQPEMHGFLLWHCSQGNREP